MKSSSRSWVAKKTKYLTFYGYKSEKRKTPTYQVRPVSNDFDFLGEIRYYPGWRKFVFIPNSNTQFDCSCLRDIADFCENDARNYEAIENE